MTGRQDCSLYCKAVAVESRRAGQNEQNGGRYHINCYLYTRRGLFVQPASFPGGSQDPGAAACAPPFPGLLPLLRRSHTSVMLFFTLAASAGIANGACAPCEGLADGSAPVPLFLRPWCKR